MATKKTTAKKSTSRKTASTKKSSPSTQAAGKRSSAKSHPAHQAGAMAHAVEAVLPHSSAEEARTHKYNPLVMLKEFLQFEAAGGIVLLFFALLAMVIANSPLGEGYHHILHETNIVIKIGEFGLDKDIIHWINDGLMAIFFFLVGLEIKREMLEGSLSSWGQRLLPGIAALGGMVVPGVIYVALNMEHGLSSPHMAGWAVPAATDIAFAVGVMSILGTRVPLSLKIFLLALAIFDDLGAIIIIALFYTSDLDLVNLGYALFFVAVLALLNFMKVKQGSMYIAIGVCLWFCVLKSGVHATLAGVIVAMAVPLTIPGERRSILRQLEHDLHPFVAYVVLPLFAFANAGVSFKHGFSLDLIFDSVTLGVIMGLFFGKQIGIMLSVWLASMLKIARLPEGVSWPQVWGASVVAGIGFTMSLFIGSLGFRGNDALLTEAKLGILLGSLISAIFGVALLYYFGKKSAQS